MPYTPPLTLTPRLIELVSRISETLGRWEGAVAVVSPKLRRENRIRSIHASLAIENNTLSISQVTDIIEGKKVVGLPREIREVKNAVKAYNLIGKLEPASSADFLKAHAALMKGLVDRPGHYRLGGVGIYQGKKLVHLAPPADRVSYLIRDLLHWLAKTDLHPLLASAVVHYEIEFIHPFADGNGRMGRLWQTMVLARWRERLAHLPIETVVHSHQSAYYKALALSDKQADAAPFAEFIFKALLQALENALSTDPACDPVSDPVERLVSVFTVGESLSVQGMMQRLQLKHRTHFRRHFLTPALTAGRITMTQPDRPHSPTQRYHLSG